MKKICVITAARSEYGLLRWVMSEIDRSMFFQLQIIVTGAHLMKEQGYTIDNIINDGFKIDKTVNININTDSSITIAASMGEMAKQIAFAFDELAPDYVMVLGDRYELLPICNSAYIMGIPIIHLSGGDVTEGAIDDGIRNAVTMLADYHFPGTKDSGRNIIRMRGRKDNIWVVGEPGLDYLRREELMSREELSDDLGLDISSQWVLFTYHPETRESLEHNIEAVKNCISALNELTCYQVVATYANTDYGGREINDYLEYVRNKNSHKFIVIPSLGSKKYLSYMKQVALVLGNSSSGIVEAPSLKVPVVNIGNRQKGRHICSNIIQCTDISLNSIRSSIRSAISSAIDISDVDYWGDGHTAERIMSILRQQLLK